MEKLERWDPFANMPPEAAAMAKKMMEENPERWANFRKMMAITNDPAKEPPPDMLRYARFLSGDPRPVVDNRSWFRKVWDRLFKRSR
jgi:hypothetical protein